MSVERIVTWARSCAVPHLCATDLDREADFRTSYCIDFGKYLTRVPAVVLRPRDRRELVACVAYLAQERTPWKARGTGHSAGGQVLSQGGVILDVRGLDRVLSIDPQAREVTVEGGATWLSLVNQLAPHGLRPHVLTDNLRMTVAGTLSVGGIGDTSLHYGLQVAHVAAITLVTPDGCVHELTPKNEKFFYVLCGRGQLGVVAAVRLSLIQRPSAIAARILRWDSLARFLQAAEEIRAQQRYEFFRSTLHWPTGSQPFHVEAVAGNFCRKSEWAAATAAEPPADAVAESLGAVSATPRFWGDRLAHAQVDPIESWDFLCPNVELVFPLPSALAALQATCEKVAESSLCPSLCEGSALMLLPPSHLPLAPLARATCSVALALRPRLRSLDQVIAQLPFLRRLAAAALRAGARLYLASIDVTEPGEFERDEFLRLQFGESLAALKQHRAGCDPLQLANRGLLDEG